jgi:hypothetical protein
LNRRGKRATITEMANYNAYMLRETTGTTGVLLTAQTAAGTLADHLLTHLVVGGIAVQEHGYPRVTTDVDLVVMDVLEAVDFLTGDFNGPLVPIKDVADRVQDRRNGTMVDLLPAGRVWKRGCKVPFPQPTVASDQLQIVRLEDLISLKLDSWSNTPLRRLRDKTDVIELIVRRNLPRDLAVAPAIQHHYLDLWDGLKAEQ